MKKQLAIVLTVAAAAVFGGGMTFAAHAGSIKCQGADVGVYIVCVTSDRGDQITTLRVGAGEARLNHTRWRFKPPYTYSRTEYGLLVDSSGLTVSENHYDSDYVFENQTWNTKHVGADGYHEHQVEMDSYHYPRTTDRSVDANGVEIRDEYNDPYFNSVDRTYVDTNPAGGVGAGQTQDNSYDGCTVRNTVNYDPLANPLVLDIQQDCP